MAITQRSAAESVTDEIPSSIRYVKNGRRRGQWWGAAKHDGQIHAGWREIPSNLIENPSNFSEIKEVYRQIDAPGVSTQDLNALLTLLDHPSQHIWITFEDGYLWWCTVRDRATVNPNGERERSGYFWLTCDRPWSNRSLNGRLLARADLPGIITRAAGFRGAVCKPLGSSAILRLIRDEQDPHAVKAASARAAYEGAVANTIAQLTWQDFEQLIDLILARTAWTRISTLGGSQEGVDIEAQNLAADEIAFVQVKSAASQATLDDYVSRFAQRRDRYARMIFAVHKVNRQLTPPLDLPVQVWTGNRLANLVVRLGLGEWVEHSLA